MKKRSHILLLIIAAISAHAPAGDIHGPLRVHPTNPRYFTDDTGRPIYLAGHQIFVDLQDNSFNKHLIFDNQTTLDWPRYLDFAAANNFNYLRNWIIWSTGSGTMAPVNKAIAWPMPYKRVPGYGRAADGRDKFDLTQFDEAFFQRMHSRCKDLQQRGIYVSIMLFEVYGFLEGEPAGPDKQTLWDGNLFNRSNNINNIHTDYDNDGRGIEFFYSSDPNIHAIQKRYVRKVLDTLNDLDNVFYEIANELYAPEWQINMIEFIKKYERTKPKQHLVMLSSGGRTRTGAWQLMPRDTVVNAPSDCYAVGGAWNSRSYRRKDPPANNTGKPAIIDMDHVSAGSSDIGYIWSAFTRGYHFNLYDHPFETPDAEGPDWRSARKNTGQTLRYAEAINLAAAAPHPELSTTTYCLADPASEYVIYQPTAEPLKVSALKPRTTYQYQWYDTAKARPAENGIIIPTTRTHTFTPAKPQMVLHLKRQ